MLMSKWNHDQTVNIGISKFLGLLLHASLKDRIPIDHILFEPVTELAPVHGGLVVDGIPVGGMHVDFLDLDLSVACHLFVKGEKPLTS